MTLDLIILGLLIALCFRVGLRSEDRGQGTAEELEALREELTALQRISAAHSEQLTNAFKWIRALEQRASDPGPSTPATDRSPRREYWVGDEGPFTLKELAERYPRSIKADKE